MTNEDKGWMYGLYVDVTTTRRHTARGIASAGTDDVTSCCDSEFSRVTGAPLAVLALGSYGNVNS